MSRSTSFVLSVAFCLHNVVPDEGGDSPDSHGVHERVRSVGRPDVAVLEHGHVPHQLEHDLGKLDGVGGRAGAASCRAVAAVRNVVLVVGLLIWLYQSVCCTT